jgi:hypothetical protein
MTLLSHVYILRDIHLFHMYPNMFSVITNLNYNRACLSAGSCENHMGHEPGTHGHLQTVASTEDWRSSSQCPGRKWSHKRNRQHGEMYSA